MSSKPIDEMNVFELKDELRARDLKVSGKKAELVERLREALEGEGPAQKKSPKAKKKSPGTPSAKASDFDEGNVKTGRGGEDYEVAVNKSGRKYWRKCTASTAKCGPAAVAAEEIEEAAEEIEEAVEEIDTEEWNKLVGKKVADLKKLAKKRDSDYEDKYGKSLVKYQLIMLILTGNPGPKPAKGTSPKRKKVSAKPVSPKKKPKPTRKGKERGEPEPEPEIRLPAKTTNVGEVVLDGWTAIGELDSLFSFLKEFSSYEELAREIEEGIDNTPSDQVEGSENIIRFEPDANCDLSSGTCGAQALGVFLESGSYDLFAEYTKSKYLKELYVGPYTRLEKAPTKADFGLVRNLVLADLRILKDIVDRYESAALMLDSMGREIFDSKFILLSNPERAKRTYIMNVNFATNGKGVYQGIHIHRA